MINQLFDLTGKTALITGGSKGIGKAVARGFAEAGADVAICSRHADELEAAAAEIGAGLNVRVAHRVCDMTVRDEVDALAAWSVETLGKVDILFNNAGSNEPVNLVDQTQESWDRILELNLTSCMRLSKALAPGMIERRWGRIVFTSSIMGFQSFSGRGSYSATKTALLGMARAYALELGKYNITVNCLAPGPVMTDLPMSLLSEDKKQEFADRTAVKRWGQVEDMVGPMLLLCSEAGAFISGTAILADGGLFARTFND
ncbi:MAG: SDR family oxidoreductase [Planctomycetales bacterium]|nr:SDR family oxidoreductase [Planctomycetales bacterium]